ncbi:hypothetical protein VN97_g737 [Penicillium thymicola]|uniref:Uncharacterized protein n=1 Tax=Penicillium thymicola TaxID=293382 RepID=A0AAI9TSA7_PENTH|nr:hypothetical protein VN97_g737 [Penicillium thymicola]
MHGDRDIKLTFVCAAIELIGFSERCSSSRPDWVSKVVQSLRTWHVSGIDGDDAGPHGEDEPRRSEAGSNLLMRDQHGSGLDWSSPCRLVL